MGDEMDPNECLEELRTAAARARNDMECGLGVDTRDAANMVEKFWELDEWLNKGGFSPWQSLRNSPELEPPPKKDEKVVLRSYSDRPNDASIEGWKMLMPPGWYTLDDLRELAAVFERASLRAIEKRGHLEYRRGHD
ncbi:MAG: hypothetical protein GY769_08160 [bacterium]|nr:hypothetical protein [bacterium]